MKIGIMSMQRIINYGSYLQAFALSHIIKNLGHSVEFIDFKIEPCIKEPFVAKTAEHYYGKDKEYFFKIQEFEEKFRNEYLPELGIAERKERTQVDTLVVGSDEVFNCLQINPNVGYSLELFGKDCNAKKIISYAASCGHTTFDELISFDKHGEISELLNKFSHISVRDENSRHFVENLSNITPINHLDPVLVYDFSNDVIDNVDLKDYIILYGYSYNFSEEESEQIKAFAKAHKKQIVSIGTYQSCADVYIPAHPLEVLPYFKKADYVITNTFHGTIFSIKTHTPFVSFIKKYNPQKLTDLVHRLGLEDRLLTSYNDLEEYFSKPIDFEKTDKIIEIEKERTIEYLKEAL